MAEESGIAGITSGREAPVHDPARLMEFVMNMKQQQKQQDIQELDSMIKLTQAIPGSVPADKIEAQMGKAYGIKLPKSPTTGQTITPQAAQGLSGASKAGVQLSGAQAGSPVTPQAAKKSPAGGMETGLSGAGTFDAYIAQIKKTQELTNISAEAKARADTATDKLRADSLSDDPTVSSAAIMKGQQAGLFAYDKNLDLISKLDVKQRGQYYQSQLDEAMKLETPADKEKRHTNYVTSLVGSGIDPKDAEKLWTNPNDPTVKKSIKQLSEEADNFFKLQESFGDEAAKKIAPQLAAGASLSEVLPNVGKTQSHFAQQMAETQKQHAETLAVQKGQLGVEQARAQTEKDKLTFEKEMGVERMDILGQRATLELDKLENQAFRQNFQDFIEATKAGVKIPKEVKDKYVQDLAGKAHMTKVESQGWINYLTWGLFGTGDVYAPDIEGGKKILDKALEGPTTSAPSPSSPPERGAQLVVPQKTGPVTPEEIEDFKRGMQNYQQ